MESAFAASPTTTLLSLSWDLPAWSLNFTLSYILVAVIVAVLVASLLWRWLAGAGGWTWRSFEIDQAEIGVGNSKFRFKPNLIDRQVAYAIWVELSTRKIGLGIDFEHDVIAEVYDSWYHFFTVTRELVKDIPVARVKRDSTQAIIKLSIEVLNEGLRPHLTQWQARFRRWYDRELKRYDESEGAGMIDPQQIQRSFPRYDELTNDMQRVNQALIRYRAKMRELVLRD
jgi:hypothetical protein